MGSTILHCCLDIRGAMRWPKRQLAKLLVRDDGSHASAEEAWQYLADELAKGHKVLPMCDCPDFDFATGCPGKRVEERTVGEVDAMCPHLREPRTQVPVNGFCRAAQIHRDLDHSDSRPREPYLAGVSEPSTVRAQPSELAGPTRDGLSLYNGKPIAKLVHASLAQGQGGQGTP